MTRERIAAMPNDDWRKDSSDFKEPKLGRALALADKLGEIGARHDVSTGAVAVAWTLAHPAITGAIVGARNARQVEGVKAALEFRLSADEVAEIEAFQKAQV
jgi:aryl-alcohol dehydrogenase-like predicted oxidoreductase